MVYDEKHLRNWVNRVVGGKASRRDFIHAMVGLGLTAPMIGSMLSVTGPSVAQAADFVPNQRGGGGRLRLLWWQAPTILNAHLGTGTKDNDASRVVYEPLAAFDPDANFVPILAADIPSPENGGLSQDGKTVTWHLKKGVTWHDGKPFTAADVVFTWEYITDPATGATSIGSYQTIERIDMLDDHTVNVVFKEAAPYWYDAFFGRRGHILPKHLFQDYKGEKSRDAPYNLKPVGTGPYKAVDFKPGASVQYEINMHYHVPNRPFFDQIELKGGGDATSAARAVLQTGEFDFAWNMQVEQRVLQSLERGGKGKVVVTPGSNVEHLQINQTDPWTEVDGERSSMKQPHPFQAIDVVRQAYAKAVDRRTVAEQFYGSAGQATGNFLNAPPRYASPNTPWEFDLVKAAALLDQTDWKRSGDGMRQKDGKPMKIVFQTSVNPIRQKTQAIIKKGFADIGMDVELKTVNAGVYFSSDPANPDTYSHFYTDIQMYTTGPGGPDPQAHMEKFVTDQIAQKGNNWSGTNIVRWSNAEYDALWKQAAGELDPVKRAALFIKMNDMLYEHNVVVPIIWRNEVSAVKTSLQGMALTTWDSDLWDLAYWHRV